MANKRISDLTPASSMQSSDLLVLQQGNTAKSISGSVFTAQLLQEVQAHGGIASIVFNADYTMTITASDGTVWTSGSLRGSTGQTGPSASVSATEYQADTQGITVPTGAWQATIPTVSSGNYLWTRFTWDNGTYSYVTCRYGVDGAGAGDMVKSIYDSNDAVATAGGIAAYVDANGGKIDHIQLNGTEQTITNKTVNLLAQAPLTFDSTPTADSTNPVTSGGIKSYVDSHSGNTTLYTASYNILSTSSASYSVTTNESGFELKVGALVRVSFTGLTVSASYASFSLNVNSTGSKTIRVMNRNSATGIFKGGVTVDFVYDGTNWVVFDGGLPKMKTETVNSYTENTTMRDIFNTNQTQIPESAFTVSVSSTDRTLLYPKSGIYSASTPICYYTDDGVNIIASQTTYQGKFASNPISIGSRICVLLQTSEEGVYYLKPAYSDDGGANWTISDSAITSGAWYIGSLKYNGSVYCFANIYNDVVYYSSDFATWNSVNAPSTGYSRLSGGYGNSYFFLTNPTTSSNRIYYSTNGASWSSFTLATSAMWTDFFYCKDRSTTNYYYLALGCSANTQTATTYYAYSANPTTGYTIGNFGNYGYTHYVNFSSFGLSAIAGGYMYVSISLLNGNPLAYTSVKLDTNYNRLASADTGKDGFATTNNAYIINGKFYDPGSTSYYEGLVVNASKQTIYGELATPSGVPYNVSKVFCTSYYGTGTAGPTAKNRVYFPFKAKLVLVYSQASSSVRSMMLYRPSTSATVQITDSSCTTVTVDWFETSVTYYNSEFNPIYQFNTAGAVYNVVAFG